MRLLEAFKFAALLLEVASKLQHAKRKAMAMEESRQQVQLVEGSSVLAMMMPRRMAQQMLIVCSDRTRPRMREMRTESLSTRVHVYH